MSIFVWFYLFLGLVALIAGGLNFLSGRFLQKRTNRLFSMIVAGLNCVQVPLGTVLGVFTLMVLNRESVARLYAQSGVETNPSNHDVSQPYS